jgi:hypothetical protein
MTEQQWLSSTDPEKMLIHLRRDGKMEERKFRLLACASVRQVWHLLIDERSIQAVQTGEDYADGNVGISALNMAEYEAQAAVLKAEVVAQRANASKQERETTAATRAALLTVSLMCTIVDPENWTTS